jgi:hypothetical protein
MPRDIRVVIVASPDERPHEGNPIDESITVTSSEGLPISVDVSLSFTTRCRTRTAMYQKFRNQLEHIKHNYMRQTVREGLTEVFAS